MSGSIAGIVRFVAVFVLVGALACAFAPARCLATDLTVTPTLGSQLGGSSGILPVGLDESSATYTTIGRLASADESLSDTLVSFRGEAVGEAVAAQTKGYAWVVLQQTSSTGTSSIQVLMSDEQVAQIEHFGAYGMKGTTLLVTGIYRVADPSQTGALDVTAYAVRVVDAGGAVEEPVEQGKLWVGLALVATGLVLTGVNVYLKRRSRS